MKKSNGDWGLGMGIGDWAQSPIPIKLFKVTNFYIKKIYKNEKRIINLKYLEN